MEVTRCGGGCVGVGVDGWVMIKFWTSSIVYMLMLNIISMSRPTVCITQFGQKVD